MKNAFICDSIRTPIGRYGGALATVRADDLAAIPIKSLLDRNPAVDPSLIDEVLLGCANQAGEDNRNIARMASLLAGLPVSVPGVTLNRLCGSGMDAVGTAGRMIRSGEANLVIAGGVESMSRAPFVMAKQESAYSRRAEIFDTTIGWRFINQRLHRLYGTDSMPETGENVALQFKISREDQDFMALRSQQSATRAVAAGVFKEEICSVEVRQLKGKHKVVESDEHPRGDTSIEKLAQLKTPFKENGTVTAGNASGVNDGSAAMLIASEEMVSELNLEPLSRVVAMATAGVEPGLMGIGPVPASEKALKLAGITLDQIDVIELNEAFASQALAVLRMLGIADNDPRVNPNGGAIALGHPLGMSGARLAMTASRELQRRRGRYALCTMCVGVGQGIALVLQRV